MTALSDPVGSPRSSLIFKPPKPNILQRLAQGLEYWRAGLAYAALLLAPLIAYVGNLGFAAVIALGGIGALVFLGRRTTPSFGMAMLYLLLIWALVSMSWSPAMPPHPDFHRYKSIQGLTGVKLVYELAFYAAFVSAMGRVSDVTAARASLWMGFGFAALSVLLVVEALDGAVVYQWIKLHAHQKTHSDLAMRNVARACYVMTVLFWPMALRLMRAHQRVVLLVLTVGLGAAEAVFKVDAPILAFALSAATFFGVGRIGRRAVWILIGGVVIYFAGAPLIAHMVTAALHPHELPGQIGKQSWAVRLDIWRFVSREILARPVLGWGLDASRAWPDDIPLHPHDAALQLWLELGVLGPCLAALFWSSLLSRVAILIDEDQTMGAAAAAAAVAYLTIGALSFGVWQEWWLAVGALAIVVCGFVAASRRLDVDFGHGLVELQPLG
jgi:O-antigen ligase